MLWGARVNLFCVGVDMKCDGVRAASSVSILEEIRAEFAGFTHLAQSLIQHVIFQYLTRGLVVLHCTERAAGAHCSVIRDLRPLRSCHSDIVVVIVVAVHI